MPRHAFALLLCLLSSATLTLPLAGQTPPKSDGKPEEGKDHLVKTTHSVTVNGTKIDYEATAGTLVLKTDDGKARANVFFVAYTRTGISDVTRRPITFAFNGGPGSSAVWLHMGCLGPRRVDLGTEGEHLAPPYHLVDNDATVLDLTDLVFIDPVSTGFSRPASGQDAKKFHGVSEDVNSVGDFIRLYVTRYGRWNSPKFLAGESYGTTRAAGLVSHLQDQLGMNCNGVILVAPALNFQTILFDAGNDLPYVLYLPGYTAAAWYHKKLSPELQADFKKATDESRRYATGPYTLALAKGSALPEAERHEVARQVARLSGLEEDFVYRHDLRVGLQAFIPELLRKEQQIIGRFDSRLKGPATGRGDFGLFADPSYSSVFGPYAACFNTYLRSELKFESDQTYELLNLRIQPWEFESPNRYLNVSGQLARALVANRDLRTFVATGYYDLATPFLSTEYTVAHLGLPPELVGHVSLSYYDGGHMIYSERASRLKLRQDLATFYAAALAQGGPK